MSHLSLECVSLALYTLARFEGRKSSSSGSQLLSPWQASLLPSAPSEAEVSWWKESVNSREQGEKQRGRASDLTDHKIMPMMTPCVSALPPNSSLPSTLTTGHIHPWCVALEPLWAWPPEVALDIVPWGVW